MSGEQGPERMSVLWAPEARADVRAIDREIALQILHCMDRYLTNGHEDVKKLRLPQTGFRLRCGDYRAFFDSVDGKSIHVTAERHRREAYR